MPESLGNAYLRKLTEVDADSPHYAVEIVDLLFDEARVVKASDIHLLPSNEGLEVRYRVDGVLQLAGVLRPAVAPNVVARLKVLADMVTYRTDIPQEGRIRESHGEVEMRVSTFPTFYGEKAVIRLFGAGDQFLRVADLGMPPEIQQTLALLLGETSGALLFAGPAGSGKSTTLYACLRELKAASGGGRSLATLEDPIEVVVPGVAQSQINPSAGFDLASGLRSMLRQDPEVIALGEIRDLSTAETAFQASLTGHLVCSTFHAGTAASVVGRLADMGIEPFVLSSGVRAIVCQRLVRRLCRCARPTQDPRLFLGLPVDRAMVAYGCDQCRSTGYRGRTILAELLVIDHDQISRAILAQIGVDHLEATARESGMVTLWERALAAVQAGETSPAEVRRVLGLANQGESSFYPTASRREALGT